jgi:Gnt-I system high-affinity gluconate transporter
MTTELATGLGLLIAFLAVVVMIIRGQSPIIMLLILAVLWAAIAGIGVDEIQKKSSRAAAFNMRAP